MAKAKNKHNVVEIGTFIFGLAVLAAIVGYLVVRIISSEETPPKLRAGIERIEGECCTYSVTIENSGSQTAEAVTILFVRSGQGGTVETTLAVDYVPAHSKREAMLVFPDARPTETVTVGGISFNLP